MDARPPATVNGPAVLMIFRGSFILHLEGGRPTPSAPDGMFDVIGIAKLMLLAITTPRLLGALRPAVEPSDLAGSFGSKLPSSRLSLRESSRKFAACVSKDDIDLAAYASAIRDFANKIESFGDFTARGVSDARQNIERVERATMSSRLRSMRSMLVDQVRKGARRPEGGPARSSGAEALLWSRLGIRFWVETFKEHLRHSGKASLAEATRHGFQRSIGRYLDRFGRAAFSVAARAIPDWDVVRSRTHLGCNNGVCSDEALNQELRSFVREVEPVLERMTQIHKEMALEDHRTP